MDDQDMKVLQFYNQMNVQPFRTYFHTPAAATWLRNDSKHHGITITGAYTARIQGKVLLQDKVWSPTGMDVDVDML